jgi:hypothetical protein
LGFFYNSVTFTALDSYPTETYLGRMKRKMAIQHIDRAGALLVFPIQNTKDPLSLWSLLHPRKKMKWEWSDEGDDAVAELWHLMKDLSSSGQVVYSKWFRGRATFFSRDLFRALLALSLKNRPAELTLEAHQILNALEEDSPLSTRELKERTELQGRLNESLYSRSCRQLYQRFLIVAFGEIEDGAFPSLAVGATRLLFEDLWNEAQQLCPEAAKVTIDKFLPAASAFYKYCHRIQLF